MRHGVRGFLLPILVGLLVPGVLLSDDSSAPGATVVSIRIDGARKTQEKVVRDLVDLKPGDTVTRAQLQRTEDKLIKSELFADVEVFAVPPGAEPKLQPGGAAVPATDLTGRADSVGQVDVWVVVDEKWTLIPIPFFSSGGDGFNGGLILLETNLLGLNKQLAAAGFGGTDGFSGFFFYSDPAVLGSPWTASVSGGFGVSEHERSRPDGTLIRALTLNEQNAGLSVGYRLTERLRLQTRVGLSQWRVDDFRSGLDDEVIEDGSYVEPQLSLAYDNTRPLEALSVGPKTTVSARAVVPQEGGEIAGEFSWGFPVFGTHRFRALVSGGYGNMPAVSEQSVSARDGFRTLPYGESSADRWSSTAAFYDLPILSAGWGTLVLSHYWELGIYDTEVISPQIFYGPGGAFRIYIKQIAIPALGLDVAYNIADPAWVFSFSFGARM